MFIKICLQRVMIGCVVIIFWCMQLSQEGVSADGEEATITDPEYLMEVMDAREAVDAADPQSLQNLQADYKQKERECIEVILWQRPAFKLG